MARCPHCQASLPEAATFCAACGRRIEGWSAAPRSDAAAAGGQTQPLPGGEEPTRAMAPTPSLLEVAALAKSARKARAKGPSEKGPVETDSALLRSVRSSRVPLALALLVVAFGAAAGAFCLVRRSVVPTKIAKAAPPAPTTPIATPTKPAAATPSPTAAATPTSAAPVAAHPKRRAPAPHRLEALTIAPRKHRRRAGHDRTGLPMKIVDTDSQAAPPPKAAPAITRADPAPLPADLPAEATPLTDDELKREAAASIDADGVRFVVKSHLPQVHVCYQRAFKDSSPGGRVEIGFAIDSAGRAIRVRTEVNTTDSALLARCLESRVKEWQFPHPVGGDYDLVYPFVFEAGS